MNKVLIELLLILACGCSNIEIAPEDFPVLPFAEKTKVEPVKMKKVKPGIFLTKEMWKKAVRGLTGEEEVKVEDISRLETDDGVYLTLEAYRKTLRMIKGFQAETEALRKTITTYNEWVEEMRKEHD